MSDNNYDVTKIDNLACEALDSFFFKSMQSTSSEFVAEPYSYHAFILSQHKLYSDVPTKSSVLLNGPPLSSAFYTEWENEVEKNIPVDPLFQSLPLKLLNKKDSAFIEDIDVEDIIDLSATKVEPESQVSLSLFGPNAVKVDNFVDDDDNSHGSQSYIPSGVQLEGTLESATDFLLQQFEKDLLADEEFNDEYRNNNKTAKSNLNKGKDLKYYCDEATIPESSGLIDYPDCESSSDSGVCTIDCGESSDQDGNERDYCYYQGPSPLSDEQLLASMQSPYGDGDDDLIRFLTAHGGRLHGLFDSGPTTTETNMEAFLATGSDEVVPF